MRVLALEPYYGGSHKAFLDRWRDGSRHEFTLLTLPPSKWKWRMRHSAITFAAETRARLDAGARWDIVFASDMLNLAEYRGLVPPAVRDLPAVAYFHENQLTYPVQVEKERDLQFAITNLTTALAADEIWWNTAFHRDDFLDAVPRFLKKMPDHRPYDAVDAVRARSRVHPQGVDLPPRREGERAPGPLRILWAARWEFDKDPETFFAALGKLRRRGVPFRASVLGQRFRRVPEVFARARRELADHLDHWGYQPTRAAYHDVLATADVAVSTAIHEFFGVGVVEALAAGCRPLLPDRLAYPEILENAPETLRRDAFYDGTATDLARRLETLARRVEDGTLWPGDPAAGRRAVARFAWDRVRPRLDAALEDVG